MNRCAGFPDHLGSLARESPLCCAGPKDPAEVLVLEHLKFTIHVLSRVCDALWRVPHRSTVRDGRTDTEV